MNTLFRFCSALAFSFATLAAQGQDSGAATSADSVAIYALLDRIEQVFTDGDLEAAMTVFTADAIILQDDGADIAGSEAIRATYAGMLQQFSVAVDFATAAIEVSGDLAVEYGTYTLKLTDKASGQVAVDTESRHLHVFKRQADGSWKTWRMMTNGLAAPAAAPAPAQ